MYIHLQLSRGPELTQKYLSPPPGLEGSGPPSAAVTAPLVAPHGPLVVGEHLSTGHWRALVSGCYDAEISAEIS